jgi:hypothetical protein
VRGLVVVEVAGQAVSRSPTQGRWGFVGFAVSSGLFSGRAPTWQSSKVVPRGERGGAEVELSKALKMFSSEEVKGLNDDK